MFKCMILILTLFNFIALAQDSTNFFPHHVGDMWEYYEIDWSTRDILDTVQRKIIKDSVDRIGNHHICMEERYLSQHATWKGKCDIHFVIDTVKQVWGKDNRYFIPPDSVILYRLNGKQGEQWVLYTYESETGFEIARIDSIYWDYYFNELRRKMVTLFYYNEDSTATYGIGSYVDILISGIGLCFVGGGFDLGWEWHLVGAYIDGVLYGDTTVVGIKKNKSIVPEKLLLSQNHPNPFNTETVIHFQIPEPTELDLHIYDTLGRRVRSLLKRKRMSAGKYEIHWDGRDEAGNPVSSGVYFYELHTEKQRLVKKMILMR